MMWSDPIADMLTRIRNASRVRRKEVSVPCSKVKRGIARILQEEGYIKGFDVIDDGKAGILRLQLRYGDRGEDVIHDIRRVSKSGCRVYRGVSELPKVLDGLGIAIVSTSRGVLSDRRCREENVSGEVLCTVY
ncbi:MAG: 30S ribosomal protein S8 [Phycisphaerales bacterium]|nr:MAG: 30S ribosomal protein S8 [Phycisphaerales bacterium]